MKTIYRLAILLAGTAASAQPHGVKPWPRITPGIYSHANVLARLTVK